MSNLSSTLTPFLPSPQKINLWITLILFELLLGYAALVMPLYIIPIFLLFLLIILMFLFPEFAYLLFILANHSIIVLEIEYPYSLLPRIPRNPPIPTDNFWVPMFVLCIFFIPLLLSWVFARMAQVRPPYPKTHLDLPIVIFLLWSTLSLLWTSELFTGFLELFLTIMVCLVFYLTVALIRTKKILNMVTVALLFLGVIYAAVAAYSVHGFPIYKELYRGENLVLYFDFITSAGERGLGLASANQTALFLNVCILLALGKFLVAPGLKNKAVLTLLIILMMFGSLITLSKSGLLGLLAGLAFFGLAYKPIRRHLFIYLLGLGVTLLLLYVLIYFSWPWPARAEMFRERVSLFPRLMLWEIGFEDLISNYGLGYGCGTMYPAHSLYFYALFELGIPALLILLWILIQWFWTSISTLKKSPDPYYNTMMIGCMAGMVALMVQGIGDFLHLEIMLWILLGIGMALVNLINGSFPRLAKSI